jgi:hypothetical protein
MTDGQVFYLAACTAIAAAATIEWAWKRRQWTRVIEQDGERTERRIRPHEATGLITVEKMIHQGTGWHVTQYGPGMLRCAKDDTVRWIWIAPPKGLRRVNL